MDGFHRNRGNDDINERWAAFERKRTSKYGVCPKCNAKKELLYCVNEHVLVYCPCRDRVCRVCGSFNGFRKPMPYQPEARRDNRETLEAEKRSLRNAEEALKGFKAIPMPFDPVESAEES